MRIAARLGAASVGGALAATLISLGTLLIPPTSVTAQQQPLDPRGFSLTLSDLPRGFVVDDGQTTVEPLRIGQSASGSDVVGVSFKTVMERPRTLEHLQSGPVRVGQIIARSDDPARATFSLDAQREFNTSSFGYEVIDPGVPFDGVMCLVRRDGPFVEYRIVAVRNADTLVSTTAIGLPSAVSLDGAIALTRLSLDRYDQRLAGVLAAHAPRADDARSLDPEVRAVATATQTPAPPTATSLPAAKPTNTPAAAPASVTAKVKLPSNFDNRLAESWSELMSSTATTKSGEQMPTFLRRVVEESDLEVHFGNLGPNVGGEHRSITKDDGDRLKVVESEVTLSNAVSGESPRVLAAMLAHEITHASQPMRRSGGKLTDCVEDEVEAYAVQARVWAEFWGQSSRPSGSKWERTMNYITEVWQDGGEGALRQVIRDETGTSTHSCIE
jgi:hypothetical protein